MQISRSRHGRRPRCTNHEWAAPMVVAGIRRWLCERCGEITLEATGEALSLPESMRESEPVG